MEQPGQAKLLRIFIGESDKLNHEPLYELIVRRARESGMAGATAWRGMLSYGRSSRLRTAKILDLSTDLPVIIEIVDRPEKIDGFIPLLNELFDAAHCGGLVTIEQVEVMRYTHKPHA